MIVFVLFYFLNFYSEKAQTNENLFKKLKEKHMNLVESHAALLRKVV